MATIVSEKAGCNEGGKQEEIERKTGFSAALPATVYVRSVCYILPDHALLAVHVIHNAILLRSR